MADVVALQDRQPTISFEQGWGMVKKDGTDPFLEKVEQGIFSSETSCVFNSKHFASLYQLIFRLCIQR